MGAHYERLLANKGANGMGDKKPKKLKVDHIKDIKIYDKIAFIRKR